MSGTGNITCGDIICLSNRPDCGNSLVCCPHSNEIICSYSDWWYSHSLVGNCSSIDIRSHLAGSILKLDILLQIMNQKLKLWEKGCQSLFLLILICHDLHSTLGPLRIRGWRLQNQSWNAATSQGSVRLEWVRLTYRAVFLALMFECNMLGKLHLGKYTWEILFCDLFGALRVFRVCGFI